MPNPASIDQLAAKELLDRGVDKSTGTFKNHSVRIGNSSAVRIDKMKSDRIPFQGFGTATRIASGTEGLRKSAARALSIMARPGKLSAGKLLGAMGEQYENAFKAAIITGGPVQTTEAMLLHAADSLDYGRVGTFDLSRFGFLNVPDGDDPSVSAQKIRN